MGAHKPIAPFAMGALRASLYEMYTISETTGD